jgi:hypothetical protein
MLRRSCDDRLVRRRLFYRQHNAASAESRHGPLFHPPYHGIAVLPVETEFSKSRADEDGDHMIDVECTASSEGIIPRARQTDKFPT